MTRPAKLQINQRGAWRDVMRFDIDLLLDETLFLETAAEMVEYSGQGAATTMRIVTDEAIPGRLMHWSTEGGWKSDGNTPANATGPVPKRPEALAVASGAAEPENASKGLKSKGA